MVLNIVLNLKTLLELLEFDELSHPKIIVDLKKTIAQSFGNPKAMRLIVDRQCEYREQTHCYSCGKEACCLILNGIAYLALEETETGIKILENANQHFRSEDETWSQIIGLTLIGNAYEKIKKDHRALREYEKAHDVITKNYLRIHRKDYKENAILLEKALQAKLDELNPNSPNKKAGQPAKTKARLSIPWMPAYTGLQMGSNGLIWVGDIPEGKNAIVAEIILNESPHDIYSLMQDDNLITLIKDREYSWAKVSGDSMNDAKPVPILGNDFVLFYKSHTADDNAIVIAALSDRTSTGYQYVVKRYSESIWCLVSETEPPNRYDPIPIMGNVRIIGVVIAVAKVSN